MDPPYLFGPSTATATPAFGSLILDESKDQVQVLGHTNQGRSTSTSISWLRSVEYMPKAGATDEAFHHDQVALEAILTDSVEVIWDNARQRHLYS
jgi:hypothetical protein